MRCISVYIIYMCVCVCMNEIKDVRCSDIRVYVHPAAKVSVHRLNENTLIKKGLNDFRFLEKLYKLIC